MGFRWSKSLFLAIISNPNWVLLSVPKKNKLLKMAKGRFPHSVQKGCACRFSEAMGEKTCFCFANNSFIFFWGEKCKIIFPFKLSTILNIYFFGIFL